MANLLRRCIDTGRLGDGLHAPALVGALLLMPPRVRCSAADRLQGIQDYMVNVQVRPCGDGCKTAQHLGYTPWG